MGLVLASALALGQTGSAQAQTPVVITPVVHAGAFEHTGVLAGESFVVSVQADSVANLAAGQFDLLYDDSVLSVASVQLGEAFDECFFDDNGEVVGILRLVFACPFETAGDDLELWEIVFNSSAGETTETSDITVDSESIVLNDNTVGDPVQIDATGATGTVTLVVGVCGDQNNSGDVNVIDVTIDLQIIVELLENPSDVQMVLSDLDQDGDIGIADAILGLQAIVGLVSLDSCGPVLQAQE
jgi:hypothetical protein